VLDCFPGRHGWAPTELQLRYLTELTRLDLKGDVRVFGVEDEVYVHPGFVDLAPGEGSAAELQSAENICAAYSAVSAWETVRAPLWLKLLDRASVSCVADRAGSSM